MRIQLAIGLLSCVLLGAVGLAQAEGGQDSKAGESKPDATLQLSEGAIAVGVGYLWGGGTLNYQGAAHKFSVSGVSIVDAGAAHLSATGEVYHLNKLSDFEGNFVAFDAGATIAGGADATVLRNEHGVVIRLVATTVGLRFNLAADGVHFRLKN